MYESVFTLLCGPFLWVSLSASLLAYEKPESLVFNYLSHPQIEQFKSVLTKSYGDIGIKVEYVSLTSERGILSVDSGLVDGDVVRADYALRNFSNSLLVNPPLADGTRYLICKKGEVCDLSVFNSASHIFATRRLIFHLPTELMQSFNGEFIEIERYSMISELILRNRGKYGLFDSRKDALPAQYRLNMEVFKYGEFKAHHILNRAHQPLLKELEPVLKANLKVLGK